MNNITINFLGSGTSDGVPMIGCNCATCLSRDPRNKRLNASILISVDSKNILIDCGRDFRQQAIRHGIMNLEHILITHTHFDHIGGIDDLRPLNHKNNDVINIYGDKEHLENLKQYKYNYLFDNNTQAGGGLARIKLLPVKNELNLEGIKFKVLPVLHGKLKCLGYKFLNTAYISDVSCIPEETMADLSNLNLLIIDALRIEPHSTHFNLEEAVELVKVLRPEKTLFTHISHSLEHSLTEQLLNDKKSKYYSGCKINLAYDGLKVKI